MTAYKLTYFDIDGGRAEPVRIAFHAAGIEFEDVRISFPEFAEMRGSTRFNSLPVLEIDGTVATQTNGMCRYVGKMAGLYPQDDTEALYCDEALGAIEELLHRLVPTFGLEGDELKAAREELVAGWISTFVKWSGGNFGAWRRLLRRQQIDGRGPESCVPDSMVQLWPA